MRSIKTRITIHSSPADVFKTLTDFSHYPDWNPWTRVSGEARDGQLLRVKPYRISYWATLTYQFDKVQKPDLLRRHTIGWFSHLVRIEREVMIYTKTDGASVFASSTRFRGPLASLAYFFYGQFVRRGMKEKAKALKQYCESRFPTAGRSTTQ